MNYLILLALGGGIGLNPPLDVHLPTADEISQWQRDSFKEEIEHEKPERQEREEKDEEHKDE